MKAILTILLLASIAANVMLLTGCMSVETSRRYSPENLLDPNIVDKFKEQLSDDPEQQRIFLSERDYLASHPGKIVIFLDNTEKNRSAKAILVRFTDGH